MMIEAHSQLAPAHGCDDDRNDCNDDGEGDDNGDNGDGDVNDDGDDDDCGTFPIGLSSNCGNSPNAMQCNKMQCNAATTMLPIFDLSSHLHLLIHILSFSRIF